MREHWKSSWCFRHVLGIKDERNFHEIMCWKGIDHKINANEKKLGRFIQAHEDLVTYQIQTLVMSKTDIKRIAYVVQ